MRLVYYINSACYINESEHTTLRTLMFFLTQNCRNEEKIHPEGISLGAFNYGMCCCSVQLCRCKDTFVTPDSKVHGANMGPIWGRQDPGGPHVRPMNLVVWDVTLSQFITFVEYDFISSTKRLWFPCFGDATLHVSSIHNAGISLHWRHNNHQPHDCFLHRLFRRRSKQISKFRVTGLCAGNSPDIGEFPAQMASNAENVSIWWRHHVPVKLDQSHGVWCSGPTCWQTLALVG